MSMRSFGRFGSSVAVLGVYNVGASLSLRSFARMGSNLAVLGLSSCGSTLSVRSSARMGSNLSIYGLLTYGQMKDLSVFEFTLLGSSLSLTNFARLGSSLSIFGLSQMGSNMAVLGWSHLGSSVSLRSLCRMGSALSVVDCAHIGASLALRSFARLSSTLSVVNFAHLGSSMSLRCFSRVGSGLSVVGCCRVGSTVSLLDIVRIGSSLALLDFAQMGSAISLRSLSRLASALSVLDGLNFGSSFSLRSLARLGSSLSVLDVINIGSTMSMRGCIRFGSSVSVHDKLKFQGSAGAGESYITWNPTTYRLEVYEKGKLGMSFATTQNTGGGTLHGVWYADTIVHTSDRRLKRSIRPLAEVLKQNAVDSGSSDTDGAAWVLRELRPVSYHYRKGAESKLLRFGFLADEVAATIPQVIRDAQPDALDQLPHLDKGNDASVDPKGLVYQDLTAVLAAALQSLQRRLEGFGTDVQDDRHRANAMEAKLERFQTAVLKSLQKIEDRLDHMEAVMQGVGTHRVEDKVSDAAEAAIAALLRLLETKRVSRGSATVPKGTELDSSVMAAKSWQAPGVV